MTDINRSARTLEGVIARVRFPKPGVENPSGFAIVVLRSGEAVKGTIMAAAAGLAYQFTGEWKNDPRWGWTFDAKEATPLMPTSADGIADYLKAHAPWIGPAVVRRVVNAYGDEALKVLKTDPDRVAYDIAGITHERAKEIQAALVAREDLERAEVEVRSIVSPAGVNGRQIRAIVDRYGRESAALVRQDPYRLIDDIDGVGWATADQIGTAIRIDRRAPGRIRAGVMHALKQAEEEGHTCMPRRGLRIDAAALLAIDPPTIDSRIGELLGTGELTTYAPPSVAEPLIFRRETYEAEASVASTILSLLSPVSVAPAVDPGLSPGEAGATSLPLDPFDPLAAILDGIEPAAGAAKPETPGREITDEEVEELAADAQRRCDLAEREFELSDALGRLTQNDGIEDDVSPPARPASTAREHWAAAALEQLADDDPDHARERNNVGFNRVDGYMGRRLAEGARNGGLTETQWRAAIALAAKYWRQVGRPPA